MSDDAPLSPETSGSDFQLPSYEIAPEDADLAAELSTFDPLSLPSPVQFTGGTFKAPERVTADVFGPQKRDAIKAQLVNVPEHLREQRETELVMAELRQNSLRVRAQCGSPGANSYVREMLELDRQKMDLVGELDRITAELTEVDHIKVAKDPTTGAPRQETVYAVTGDRRRTLELRVAEIVRHIHYLDGPEGERRLQKALYKAVEEEKAKRLEIAQDREARARADRLLSEERIEAKAKSYARMKRRSDV